MPRKVVEPDATVLRHRHRGLHAVVELANVSRPLVGHQARRDFGRQLELSNPVARRVLDEEMPGELEHVVVPLSQRRQMDPHHVEPEQ